MNLDRLREELVHLAETTQSEERLVEAVRVLRPANGARSEEDASADELVSFDADGTGYTAEQLGDMLDETVEEMRRGEGVLTLEEFKARRNSWRERM